MQPDVANHRVVLYGSYIQTPGLGSAGTDPNDQDGSTWVFENGDWRRLPELDPPPLLESWTALEEWPPRERQLFLNSLLAPGAYDNQTWVYEHGEFRQLATTVVPRTPDNFSDGGCHEGLGLTVVHGKYQSGFNTMSPATWYWNGSTWAYQPAPFDFHATTYDPDRGALVVVRGGTQEIYEWYGPTQGWIVRPNSQLPFPRRDDYVLCYDRARHRLVYAGGRNLTGVYTDTWEYDGTTWQQIATTSSLPPNSGGGYSRYVPEVGGILAVIMVAGYENETWTYNGAAWRKLEVERGLPWIGWNRPYQIAYDPLQGVVRTMRGGDCSMAETGSHLWTLEFRTLLPDTYLPRLGQTVQLSIDAPTQPLSFFGIFLSGDDYPGIPLPGLPRILPLANDWILRGTGLLPGLYGLLDHNGRSNRALPIPNHPAFDGLDLHCAMLTLTPAGNLGVVSNGVHLAISR